MQQKIDEFSLRLFIFEVGKEAKRKVRQRRKGRTLKSESYVARANHTSVPSL
jgi:hypothetical protein